MIRSQMLQYIFIFLMFAIGCDPVAAEDNAIPRVHPYLFFDAEGLERLRSRLEMEPFKSRWAVFLRSAEHSLQTPVAEGGGQWDRKRARDALKVCGLTGFAYAITGDARFGDRAKAELLAVLSADRWMNPGAERFTRGADLATADGALISALVYDWCYDRLTKAEKKQVQDRVQALAFDYYQISVTGRPDWWVNNPVSNWTGVCHGGIGLAGLAFYDKMPAARAVVDSAWAHVPQFLDSVTGVDGAGHEGVMYFEYGVGYGLRFVDAYARVMGADGGVFAQMVERLVGYWLVYMQGPDGRYANFNDMEEHTFAGLGMAGLAKPPTGGPSATLLALLEAHTPGGDRLLRWGADHGSMSYIYWGPEPSYFFWRSDRPVVPEKPVLDRAVLFRTAGHTIFQSPGLWMVYNGGWISDKSHHNFDLGSFVFVADGERFVHDPGYNKKETGDHSTVLINGVGQPKGAGAKTLRFGSEDGFDYVLSDLSEAYRKEAGLIRFHRHVLMVDGQYIVLLDDLKTRGDGHFDWRLQTRKSVEIQDNRAILRGEKINVHVLSAGGGKRVSIQKSALDFVQVVPQKENTEETFVTVLVPSSDEQPTARFDNGRLAVTIGERTDQIVFEQLEKGWQLKLVNGVDASRVSDGSQRVLTTFRD